MKRLFVTLICFWALSSYAQEISIEPTNHLIGQANLEEYNVYQVYIKNEAESPIDLSWRIIENTMPEEWTVTLCDNVACYGILPANANMDPIAVGDSSLFKIDVHPGTTNGHGILRFLINETGTPTPYKEHIFDVSTLTTDTKDLFEGAVSVFPNPTTELVNIKNTLSNELSAQLMDLSGKLLNSTIVASGDQHQWILSDLAKGTYYLRLQTGHHAVIRTIVIQ